MAKLIKVFLLCFLAFALMTGCNAQKSGEAISSNTPAPPSKPSLRDAAAEIVISVNFSDEDFKLRYTDIIRKAFPNIAVKQLKTSNTLTFENIVSSGTQMDIIDQGITNLNTIIDLNLPIDLDSLVKLHNVDLSRFDSFVINDIRSYAPKNELFLIPYTIQPFVLHYNKSLFDKFGVEYPKPGNTWDDLIELSKKLSRAQDGVNYRGLHAGINVNRIQTQLALPFVDTKTGKSAINTNPGWTKLLQTYSNIYSVPGNFPEGATVGDGNAKFITDKTLAMFPHLISIHSSSWVQAINEGMQIGVTTYPVFKDAPKVGTGLFGGGLAISRTSKQPELALEIIKYYTSDEVQIELGKLGLNTPLVSEQVRSKFLEGNPVAKLFDTKDLYRNQIAAPYPKSKWDGTVRNTVQSELQRFMKDKVDINTFSRQLDEKINQYVQTNP